MGVNPLAAPREYVISTDLPLLDSGKSCKWNVILFESNCIILRHNTSDQTQNII